MLYNHRLGKWMKGTLHKLKSNQFHAIPPPKNTQMITPPPIINAKIPKNLLKRSRAKPQRKSRVIKN